jgi:hypothetical protein
MKVLNKTTPKRRASKKARRKFFKSIITVTVLSEGAPISSEWDLKDIGDAITDGDMVGEVEISSAYRITRKETVANLIEMRSVPEFFNLDDKGRDVRE